MVRCENKYTTLPHVIAWVITDLIGEKYFYINHPRHFITLLHFSSVLLHGVNSITLPKGNKTNMNKNFQENKKNLTHDFIK